MKTFLENDLKLLSIPLGILLVIFALGFISGKIILDNISRLNGELSNNTTSENMLQTKLSSLQKINDVVSSESQAAIIALPGTNSVISTLSEIQTQAVLFGLTINNIRSSDLQLAGQTNTAVETDIDFNADGSFTNIASFIKAIKNSAPINRFDTLRISTQSLSGVNLYRLNATLATYWAPLPTTIPAITEPLVQLSGDDQKFLNQISVLVPAAFTAASSSASVNSPRADPFSL